eukprot:ANDGO_02722.mRNA.1 Putative elongator complex protein 4
MKSTFVKKGANASTQQAVPGVRSSAHTAQYLLSTGSLDLDKLFGGGVALGSVVLLVGDAFSRYSQVFTNLFLTEAVLEKRRLHFISCCTDPYADLCGRVYARSGSSHPRTFTSVDKPVVDSGTSPASSSLDLKIAWQYAKYTPKSLNLGMAASSETGGPVDTSKHISADEIHSSFVSVDRELVVDNIPADATQVVLIDSFEPGLSEREVMQMSRKLRAYARLRNCVVWVHLDAMDAVASMLSTYADYVMEFQSFLGADMDVSAFELSTYSGIIAFRKLPTTNSFSAVHLDDRIMGFKMRLRSVSILKLQQAPEESRDNVPATAVL